MKTDRQAHDALTDRREYSPRIWFEPTTDAMEEAGLGVGAVKRQTLKDCTPWNALDYIHTAEELQAYVDAHVEAAVQQGRKVDRWVNACAMVLVLAVAAWAVFA
jgi:hypothetical protein